MDRYIIKLHIQIAQIPILLEEVNIPTIWNTKYVHQQAVICSGREACKVVFKYISNALFLKQTHKPVIHKVKCY